MDSGLITLAKKKARDDGTLSLFKSGLFYAKRSFVERVWRARRAKTGKNAVRQRFDDMKLLAQWCSLESPTIVDGGANTGSTIKKFLLTFDDPTILALEPIPELHQGLDREFQEVPQVEVYQCALGEEEAAVEFRVNKNRSTSSFLDPSDVAADRLGKMVERTNKIEVPKVALDGKFDREIDIIKLDVQGYEYQALLGAEETLSQAKIVMAELQLSPIYEGQHLFSDVDQYLRGEGFQLFNLYDIYTDGSGQITTVDAIYYNAKFF